MLTQGVLVGITATVAMDIWAAIAKHGLALPTTNWAMVGRWFGAMPCGRFAHDPISASPRIRHELALGWLVHYAVGILYGVAYLLIVVTLFSDAPSLISALAFSLATLAIPWFVMQPAMGLGVFASRAPRPMVLRLLNVSMHLVFGAGLYLGWLLAA